MACASKGVMSIENAKTCNDCCPSRLQSWGGSRLHQRSIHAARNPGQHVSQARSIDESRGIVIRVTRKA